MMESGPMSNAPSSSLWCHSESGAKKTESCPATGRVDGGLSLVKSSREPRKPPERCARHEARGGSLSAPAGSVCVRARLWGRRAQAPTRSRHVHGSRSGPPPYALALHRVCVRAGDSRLPPVLIIDTPTKNVSSAENPEVIAAFFRLVCELALKSMKLALDSSFH